MSSSGWFCDRIEGKLRCIPFNDYVDKGWVAEDSKPYQEVFPNYKDHDVVLDTSSNGTK